MIFPETSDRIRFNDPFDGDAIAGVAGTHFNPLIDVSICRVRDNSRLGGVIFNNYTEESIAIHSASWVPRWVNRDLLWVTFDYPFNQLGVNRIFGMVPEDNHHARAFNSNLGFEDVARIAGVYQGNVACRVMCMERGACRFLNIRPRSLSPGYRSREHSNGKKVPSAGGS
jgi:RimJ/RimL family protein N-acetyltransferase